jgi:Uncharacterized protein conserved in bacteria (DUF2325)
MCQHQAPLLTSAQTDHVPSPALPCTHKASADGSSRRKRLWELSDQAHCPVVGVCLTMPMVRKLVTRIYQQNATKLDDYETHCLAVTASKHRTPLGELIQKALDQRCALTLQQAAKIKQTSALMNWWLERVHGPELGPAFWATLTHPCCDEDLERRVLGHVHMLQHQVGMGTRVDMARHEALVRDHSALRLELGAAQSRIKRLTQDFTQRLEALERVLMQTRAELMAKSTESAHRQDELAALQAAAPDLPARVQLAQRQRELITQNQALRRALQQAELSLTQQQQRLHALPSDREPAANELVAGRPPAIPSATTAAQLNHKAVLCVGGRPAIVPIYRQLIEHEGARFLHHDGGEEESSQKLDATLAAADLVICQTGCISHNAYWRVKAHCKRTGKPCVFLDTPSRSALSRALQEVASGAIAEEAP